MNQKLGSTAREEIRKATDGLVGSALKEVIQKLTEKHPVTSTYIYRMTEDQRKGKRKSRADKGQRKFELKPGTDVWHAASLVIAKGSKLNPEEALRTARANGHTNLPNLALFRTILAQNDLDGKQRRSPKRSFHLWEAEYPLGLIQIDCTALKMRFQDEKTRRVLKIEGIDKNHPNLDRTKVRVWQIMAVDDHSRRRFLRYVVTDHIDSHDMVEFVSELYCAWGIPEVCYTDNGPEFKGFFTQASKVLAAIPSIVATGGYQHLKHKPGNSQASGKVEVAHKWAEQMDRYIGLAISRGLTITQENLNPFADEICNFYNEQRVHRATGQTPISRWHGTHITLRKIDPTTIRQALLSDSFDVKLNASMTIIRKKLSFAVPTKDPETGKPSVFMKYIDQMVKVVIPEGLDFFFITLPDGSEYQIDKVIDKPHAAGQYEGHVESNRDELKRELQATFEADSREAKELKKLTNQTYQVPFFNHEVAVPQTNIAHFPHGEQAITDADVNTVTPVVTETYSGRDIGYWQAVAEYGDRFASKDEAKQFLLGLFPQQQGTVPAPEIETAIDTMLNPNKQTQEVPRLRVAS